MKYDITGILSKYPEIHIGVLVGRNMDNKRQVPELYGLQKEAIKSAKNQIGDQPPTKHPHIASWRELYRSFGTKAGDYRPSAEALVRRCIKEEKLPRINNAVDLYNVLYPWVALTWSTFKAIFISDIVMVEKRLFLLDPENPRKPTLEKLFMLIPTGYLLVAGTTATLKRPRSQKKPENW